MTDKQKKISTLKSLISKWHIIRQKSVPLEHLLYAMAEDIESGIPTVPVDKVYACWMDAKSQSDFMPMDGALNESWKRMDTTVNIANGRIEYKPTHSCKYCPVVALRLGVTPPEETEGESRKASEPPDSQEIQCVLATVGKDKIIFEYWNTNEKSPYRGML